MGIQKIKATKTASLTDLRDPRKIIDTLADGQVAILDRNKIVAYIQHPSQVEDKDYSYLPEGVVKEIFMKRKVDVEPVLEYLKDK